MLKRKNNGIDFQSSAMVPAQRLKQQMNNIPGGGNDLNKQILSD